MAHNVRDLLREWFGDSLPTYQQSSDATIGVLSIRLVNVNARRCILRLTNSGSSAIAIERTAGVTFATGIELDPGETMTLMWMDDLDDVTLEWWAISNFAGVTIHIIETILTGADDAAITT